MEINLKRQNSRSEFQQHNDLFRPQSLSLEESEINNKLYHLMCNYSGTSPNSIQTSIIKHVEYTLFKNRFSFNNTHCYQAAAHSIRDRLIESFNDTQQYMHNEDVKRVYYLSLEYLLGRVMLEGQYKEALEEIGYCLEEVYEKEVEPALGNGGLGRLAACFLDSLATLNYPAWGYGIRYNYGIFRQKIIDGYQVEVPDYWLQYGNPWEVQRSDVVYTIKFYGEVSSIIVNGIQRQQWINTENIIAEAYDNIIPGFNTFNSINLRLWKSIPTNEFDFQLFNQGDYFKAIELRQKADYISSVLYPNDSTVQGKELRLKQQYFFVSATLQDILRRFRKRPRQWSELPLKASLQLNDTHPGLAIIELMRILLDDYQLSYSQAFSITYQTISYTNHTTLPEALELWSVSMIKHLLPRHLEIIYLINHYWMQNVIQLSPYDLPKLERLSIIQEKPFKAVRMANLCVVGSHIINGVSKMHTSLIKSRIFSDFNQIDPNKFINITNGVSPRRWIGCCNPFLTNIYNQYIDKDQDWVLNTSLIKKLLDKKSHPTFQQEWQSMKRNCKIRLAKFVKQNCGIDIDVNSLFDMQVKRIHEYKRQLLNIFYIVHRYLALKSMSAQEKKQQVSRTVFFSGKAAPSYTRAKQIIKLINSISETINNDKETNDMLKVVFISNYNVSSAQIIIPASDISQHISLAGMEASGTSNMKFVMNGGVILGTEDGANLEIAEAVGLNNIFLFGKKAQQVETSRYQMRVSLFQDYAPMIVQKILEVINSGLFGFQNQHTGLLNSIMNQNDEYLVIDDFESYLEVQRQIDEAYQDQETWLCISISNALITPELFTSDRVIHQYAQLVWNIYQHPVPSPSITEKDRINYILNTQ